MWRPDLVPHILRWLGSIPPASMQHLVRLRVSDIGGFIAIFQIGSSEEVYFEFDDKECMTLRVPTKGWYILTGSIVPFEQRHVEIAIAGRSVAGVSL
jgi:hypothetical protein